MRDLLVGQLTLDLTLTWDPLVGLLIFKGPLKVVGIAIWVMSDHYHVVYLVHVQHLHCPLVLAWQSVAALPRRDAHSLDQIVVRILPRSNCFLRESQVDYSMHSHSLFSADVQEDVEVRSQLSADGVVQSLHKHVLFSLVQHWSACY